MFPLKVIIFSCLCLLLPEFSLRCQAQPFRWNVHEARKGDILFSVQADTLFGLSKNLFSVALGEENILFRNDPFHPLTRFKKTDIRPLTEDFFAVRKDQEWILFRTDNGGPARAENFRNFRIWKNCIVAESKEDLLLLLPSGEDIRADSVQFSGERILLFKKDGILLLDSLLKSRFYKTGSSKRKFNAPYYSFLLSDSSWIALKGGPSFAEKPQSFWWNDTCLLDSSAGEVFIQTPSIKRKKIADSVVLESPYILWMASGKKQWLRFRNGKKIPLKPHFERRALNDSLCAVRFEKGWVFYSITGNRYPLKPVISEIGRVAGPWLMVRANKRWGCADHTGIIRISCRYDSILPMSQGLMAVKLGREWGFLDADERIRIQLNFHMVQPFLDSVCLAARDKKYGLIKPDGSEILPFHYDKIWSSENGNWLLMKEKWMGIAAFKGKILLKPRYSDIIEAHSGFIRVERDGHYGLFDSAGKQVLPLESARIIPDKANGILISR
jgi:hypothetical protein